MTAAASNAACLHDLVPNWPASLPRLGPALQVLYCKYQPNKKMRKNKSFADGVLEVAVDTKRAVSSWNALSGRRCQAQLRLPAC